MKKIDLGQAIGIVANLGVIAGIVFLAIEIRQNNSQLAAQTQNTLFELRADIQRDFINNVGGIAEMVMKEQRGEPLTDLERVRLGSRKRHMIRTFEYMYRTDPDGLSLQLNFFAFMFRDNNLNEAWLTGLTAETWDPEFVNFMQEDVLPLIEGNR